MKRVFSLIMIVWLLTGIALVLASSQAGGLSVICCACAFISGMFFEIAHEHKFWSDP